MQLAFHSSALNSQLPGMLCSGISLVSICLCTLRHAIWRRSVGALVQHLQMSEKHAHDMQAELLQQEIINRQRLSAALERLVEDLPQQVQAAEQRIFMAEYVKGYQLVSLPHQHTSSQGITALHSYDTCPSTQADSR